MSICWEFSSELMPALDFLLSAIMYEEKVKRLHLIYPKLLHVLSFDRSLTSTLVENQGTCQLRRNCCCGPRRWQLVTQESNAPTFPPAGVMGRCSMHLFTDTGKWDPQGPGEAASHLFLVISYNATFPLSWQSRLWFTFFFNIKKEHVLNSCYSKHWAHRAVKEAAKFFPSQSLLFNGENRQ